jgi:hypothetical protein
MKYIITENQFSLIINEQSMGGMSSPQTFADASTSSAKAIASKLSKYSFDQFMEDMRSFMESGTGLVIQTLLDGTGLGKMVNMSAWALLTMYDVMKGITKGAWNWFHILVDLAGVLLSGPGAEYVKKTLGGIAGKATGKLTDFVTSIKKLAPKAFGYLSNLVKSFSSVISKVSSAITNFIGSTSKYLKGTSIYNGLMKVNNSITSSLDKVLKWIETAFGKKVAQTTQKTSQVVGRLSKNLGQDTAVNKGAGSVTG